MKGECMEQITFPLYKETAPPMPEDYKGDSVRWGGITTTTPRQWTEKELEWIKSLQAKGYSKSQIAESVGRSEISVQTKLKRIGKAQGTYNKDHIQEKYMLNSRFLDEIQPTTILDLYCGTKSFYKGTNTITNDIDKTIEADYHMDAFKLICSLYAQGKKFDLIDLDPYGSAYDCFDLAVKMARKGLVITLGEMGHKRWKRLDYVSRHYDICTLEEFTIDNLIAHIQKIGQRNKKALKVWAVREWRNIGRVYFTIENIKIMEQWERGQA